MSLIKKIKIGIKNPLLAMDYIFGRRYKWIIDNSSDFKKKRYESYSEYIKHQKSKLRKINWLKEYDGRYRIVLHKRLIKSKIVKPGMTVLCLAARLGTEVKSFLDLGCFAIGLDLNPGIKNKYVVYGDFHKIQFPDHSVDVIFTNSLDHTFDLDSLIKEIKRVLRPNGLLILDIVRGEKEGYNAGYYEAFIWNKIEDLLEIFKKSGFKILNRFDFDYPWNGQHISLKLK